MIILNSTGVFIAGITNQRNKIPYAMLWIGSCFPKWLVHDFIDYIIFEINCN